MKLNRQFLRFCLVGFVGLVVDLFVLHALAPLSNWYAARVVSFWSAATTTWFLNRNFTFDSNLAETKHKSKLRKAFREYRHYLLAMVAGGSLNYLTYALTLQNLLSPEVAPFV